MEKSCDKISSSVSSNLSSEDENTTSSLNFKETELRLGLPGCDSPENNNKSGVSLFGKDLQKKNNGYSSASSTPSNKNLKRGFPDAISSSSSSSRKWIFSQSDAAATEADLENGSNNTSARCNREVDMVPHYEKPAQVAATNDHATVPAPK